MKKIIDFIVDKRKYIYFIFLVLTVLCAIAIPFVKVNYDTTKYLPSDSKTMQGMTILEDEFSSQGNITLMATDISLTNGYELKKQILKIENVSSVFWLDDIILELKPMYAPTMSNEEFFYYFINLLENSSETIDPLITAQLVTFYKDSTALYQINFVDSAYEKTTIDAIRAINNLGDFAYAGNGATAYATFENTQKEIIQAAIIAIPLIIIVLLLATSSFFEPILFFIIIGVSILLNMGSNILLKDVSYLTQSLAALLQLALTMDYLIFLLHKYKNELKVVNDPVIAMKTALRKSFSPISASSLTTIAGFIALMLMKNHIGLDMGIVLGKSIIMSMLSVFLLMPGLIITFNKPLIKLEHRSLLTILKSKNNKETINRSSQMFNLLKSTRFVLPFIFIALLIPACILQSQNTFLYGNYSISAAEDSELTKDREAIEKSFGSTNQLVILLPKTSIQELPLSVKLSQYDKVISIQSYSMLQLGYGEMLPLYAQKLFLSDNYSRIIMTIDLDEEGEETFEYIEKLEQFLNTEIDSEYYLIGASSSAYELKQIGEKDNIIITIATIVFIFIILVCTFKSISIPFILLFCIEGAIMINMAIPRIANNPIVFMGYLIVMAIQMGATIDYGILLTNNYVKNRQLYSKFEAMRKTLSESFLSILTSATILIIIGYAVGISSSLPATSVIGTALGRGALLSFVTIMLLLPTLLMIFDSLIKITTYKNYFIE